MRYVNLLKNLSNWWLYLAVKFGFSTADPLLFRTRTGVVVEVPWRLLQTFKEIFMDECYLRGRKLRLGDNPIIIDIGANAGFFTLFALSETGARVFSYEPIPVNFRQLTRNAELNPGFSATCRQKAVAGESGTITLSYDPHDAFTTAATMYGTGDENSTITVPSVSLPDVFRENSLVRCDLLKMDCEGAEYDILYNCPPDLLSRIRNMAMEVHVGPGPKQNIDSLDAYLKEMGFSTRRRPVGMLWAWRP